MIRPLGHRRCDGMTRCFPRRRATVSGVSVRITFVTRLAGQDVAVGVALPGANEVAARTEAKKRSGVGVHDHSRCCRDPTNGTPS